MILAGPPAAGMPMPGIFDVLARGERVVPVWLNPHGGLTARLGGDRFAKWSPPGRSLDPERHRLEWAAQYHPVPRVLDHGEDVFGSWLLTAAIDGTNALTLEPATAAKAVGAGLRALHDDLPVASCPFEWSPASRGAVEAPPIVDRLVVCHGDACVPNTLVGVDGNWSAHVDLGSLGLADRWADIAVASENLDANFGPGWQPAFFEAYGIEPDAERMAYYRALWNAPSA